jgi:lipopolysaccharide/colanic/teichoic acid biosynthesis glycosyltransferase
MNEEAEKEQLLEELSQRYGMPHLKGKKFVYLRKKYFWLIIVKGSMIIKRLLDISLSLLGLILLSPLFLIISLLIKLYDGGDVLFITNRVGKWGHQFRFPKFRTMHVGADRLQAALISSTRHIARGKSFKMENDPRITPIGRFLRKTSLDELPQLLCVLLGTMSLVGPRPPLPSEVALYTMEERRRLDITPGLTCIWQVTGRSELPFDTQVQLDLEYIESQSLWLDLKLLMKTIPAVLFGRGAY